MDPISTGLSAIGIGMSLFGGMSASADAKKAAGINSDIAGKEGEVNDQREAQMQLSARRNSLEIFRNMQRAKSQGLATAVSQGAQFGTGLAGGQAQATNQGLFNAQGVNQNLQIGENIFSIDRGITADKQQLSQVQGQMATDQGWASLGGSILKSAGTVGNISGAIGGGLKSMNLGSGSMGGGSPSGYGS